MKKSKEILIRVTPEEKTRIEETAKQENRSISGLFLHLFLRFVDGKKNKKGE